MEERLIALHEAAHAVVARELGHHVRCVSILPEERRLGFVDHGIDSIDSDADGGSILLDHVRDVVAWEPIEPAIRKYATDKGNGYAQHLLSAFEFLFELLDSDKQLRWYEMKLAEAVRESIVLIAMAGQAAECVAEERTEPDWEGGSSGDWYDIQQNVMALAMIDPSASEDEEGLRSAYAESAYTDYLWARALQMVEKSWGAVERLADRLQEHKRLEGDAVFG